jgi:hypothetical protein
MTALRVEAVLTWLYAAGFGRLGRGLHVTPPVAAERTARSGDPERVGR